MSYHSQFSQFTPVPKPDPAPRRHILAQTLSNVLLICAVLFALGALAWIFGWLAAASFSHNYAGLITCDPITSIWC